MKNQKEESNRPETEEDGIKAESIRRLKIRHMVKAAQNQPVSNASGGSSEKSGVK